MSLINTPNITSIHNNQIKYHLGKKWLGIQGPFSFNYFLLPFKVITTFNQLYFITLNKLINRNWLKLLEEDLINVLIGSHVIIRALGVGYRLDYSSSTMFLSLKLGFSHEYKVKLLPGLTCSRLNDRSSLYIFKFDNKAILNNVVASIKRIRPIEPYKGKGLRFINEFWKRKAGKKNSL